MYLSQQNCIYRNLNFNFTQYKLQINWRIKIAYKILTDMSSLLFNHSININSENSALLKSLPTQKQICVCDSFDQVKSLTLSALNDVGENQDIKYNILISTLGYLKSVKFI